MNKLKDLSLFAQAAGMLTSATTVKRTALMLLAVMMTLGTQTAWAEVTYQWDGDTKTLTFSGSGELIYEVSDSGHRYDVKTAVIGSGVTSIIGAFYDCSNLTTVTFEPGSQLTSIGDNAFANCSNLTSIAIPNSVTTIGFGAFTECYGLKSFIIPASVTSIENDAFFRCNLEIVVVQRYTSGESPITSLVDDPFDGCDALKMICVPNDEACIAAYKSASNWDKYEEKIQAINNYCGDPYVNDGKNVYYAYYLQPVTQEVTLAIAGSGAMNNYSAQPWLEFDVKTVNIGYGVTSISQYAFYNRNSLTSVPIPASVTSISNNAFEGCTGLTSITIPASVESIGKQAFDRCTGLTSVSIPSSVTSIYGNTFNNCNILESINVDVNNQNYASEDGVLFNKDKTTLVRYPQGKSGTSYDIPADVTSINTNAFQGCSNLVTVYALRSESVPTLGDDVFENCNENLAIVVPTAVKSNYATGWSTYSTKLKDGYTVTCAEGITATGANNGPLVEQGEEVTLSCTGTAPAGYTTPFIGYSVKDANNSDVTVSETSGVYTFTMPASNVTVSATWTTIPWSGTGTADTPYIIEYPSQLDLLATNVNGGEPFSGKFFKLGADITYSHKAANEEGADTENNYTAIGCRLSNDPTDFHPFSGTFDGDGHTISGIRIYQGGNDWANHCQGLFGYTDGATVKNVTLADARITGCKNVGGIVGWGHHYSSEPPTVIENCQVLSDVAIHAVLNDADNHGGIVGYAYESTLRYNLAIGSTITNVNNAGAIVGYNYSSTTTYNYYSGCTVGTNTSGIGCNGDDITTNDGAVEATILSESAAVPTTLSGKTAFRRSFTGGKASTVCLPFGIDADQAEAAGKFFTFVGVDKTDPDNWEVIMREEDPSNLVSGALSANTPYLFKPAATGPVLFHGTAAATISAGKTTYDGWEFTGTYEKKTWESGQTRLYGFAAADFEKADGTLLNDVGSFQRYAWGYCDAFRCYLWAPAPATARGVSAAGSPLPESMKVRIVSASGETTVIGTLDTRTGDVTFDGDVWYGLDGRRLNGKPTKKGLYLNNGKTVLVP